MITYLFIGVALCFGYVMGWRECWIYRDKEPRNNDERKVS